MKNILLMIFLASSLFAQVNFDDYFFNKTLRMDYFHFGNHSEEQFIFDELIEEEYWGGSLVNLIDTLRYGNFFFEVYDKDETKVIYSRGFSCLFQEWQSTKEAKRISRAFPETIVFPYPKREVVVKIYVRGEKNKFTEAYSIDLDPNSYFVKKEKRYDFPAEKIHYSGNHNEKLDIVFLPEGYTAEEMDKFRADCKLFSETLFDYEPYDKHEMDINIWAVIAPSLDSGVDIPADTVWKRTLLNSSFYTLDSERYLMTQDIKKVRDVAANAPYDQIYIIANDSKYGGGAIYNYYSLTVAGDPSAKKVFIHELGHGLAGLADEYGYDSTYMDYYPKGTEPWEPNITTMVDFESKWKDMIDEDTPVPTPDEEKYRNKVGVFEGGGYVPKGVYRPTFDSIMRSFRSNEYNDVCKEVISKVIEFYTK